MLFNRRLWIFIALTSLVQLAHTADPDLYGTDCQWGISVGDTVNSRWTSECDSVHRTNYSDPYNPRPEPGKFFTFVLERDADVRINITGGFNRQLYLLEGDSPDNTPILSRQDSLIETWLPQGTYTIEATSSVLYNFELELSYNDLGNQECVQALSIGTLVSDGWTAQCESNNRDVYDPYSPHPSDVYRAKYFTFTLDQDTDILLDVESSVDTYIYLLQGTGEFAVPFKEFDASEFATSLPAGDYTIELTTKKRYAPGQFTIKLDTITNTNPCYQELELDQIVDGAWSSSCLIERWDDTNTDPYVGENPERANYYTFTLGEAQDVQFSRFTGGVETVLTLYKGSDFQEIVGTNAQGGIWNQPKNEFSVRLESGNYTLEVTAHDELAIGNYRFQSSVYSNSQCKSAISLGTPAQGLIADGCYSSYREPTNNDPYGPQSGTYYAKQFEFTLTNPTTVQTVLSTTGSDAYLYLAKKDGDNYVLLNESIHDYWDSSTFHFLERILDEGTYLVEATTEYPEREVEFTLNVREMSGTTCDSYLVMNSILGGSLQSGRRCTSEFKDPIFNNDPYGPNHGYQYFSANAYTFKVEQAGQYEIVSTANNVDTHFFLVEGTHRRGLIVTDQEQLAESENRMSQWLEPGYYTVEVTTTEVATLGDYSIYVTDGAPLIVDK